MMSMFDEIGSATSERSLLFALRLGSATPPAAPGQRLEAVRHYAVRTAAGSASNCVDVALGEALGRQEWALCPAGHYLAGISRAVPEFGGFSDDMFSGGGYALGGASGNL